MPCDESGSRMAEGSIRPGETRPPHTVPDERQWVDILERSLESGEDLLPLPPAPRPSPPRGRSHRLRRRYQRALALWEAVEQTRLLD